MVTLQCATVLRRGSPFSSACQIFSSASPYASSSSSLLQPRIASATCVSSSSSSSSLYQRRLFTTNRRDDGNPTSQDFYAPGPEPTSGPSVLPHTNQTTSFPPKNFPSAFGSNQVLPVPEDNQERLAKILSAFDAPIRFAFAYGSGVFPQEEAGPEHAKRPEIKEPKTGKPRKMVDLVLAVAHPEHWHGLNKQRFPKHYSWISRLTGAELITGWVQRLGAGLWYIPYVKIEDDLVKYGVMDIDTLCDDLLDWDTLYVSGRMHKPVAMLITDPRVRLAQQVNLASALRVSLLLLPETFTEVELYTRIASLSYTGDFRMSVPGGENANKVRNIVLAQRSQFRRLYSGLIGSLGTVEVKESREDRYYMIQDRSAKARSQMAERLPLRLREKVMAHYLAHPELDKAFLELSLSTKDDEIGREPPPQHLLDAFWLAAVQRQDFETILLGEISRTVKGAAWSQSLKGLYTAGLPKTFRYVWAKVGKYFEGKKDGKKENEEGNTTTREQEKK
ncbi:Mmp37-domain-containing protein [Microstroma glucosiphilum]|uniref:Phosphatidate cytidylyltransferase, mitochondrial n=1 Tax=Pseudomicrostroma glucosiphilum TaxID=1684307 RepID=A0A316U4N2_9BASI|nr:Mmp37-domain-containing protein [Pseudomicrostroma glucosiphilum]PWN19778.1 Mmp37-domain-containing protein [Pseudomicrostroma glucosiphilum]